MGLEHRDHLTLAPNLKDRFLKETQEKLDELTEQTKGLKVEREFIDNSFFLSVGGFRLDIPIRNQKTLNDVIVITIKIIGIFIKNNLGIENPFLIGNKNMGFNDILVKGGGKIFGDKNYLTQEGFSKIFGIKSGENLTDKMMRYVAFLNSIVNNMAVASIKK